MNLTPEKYRMNFKLKTNFFCFASIIILASLSSTKEAFSRMENEIGVTTSYYKYEEPNLMNIKAINIGADYTATFLSNKSWFMRGNIIGAISTNAKYNSNGTGSKNDKTNWHADIRTLFGKNFEFENSTLAPYAGFGYRHLYNDGRGTTNTNHKGYRRESNYCYAPLLDLLIS